MELLLVALIFSLEGFGTGAAVSYYLAIPRLLNQSVALLLGIVVFFITLALTLPSEYTTSWVSFLAVLWMVAGCVGFITEPMLNSRRRLAN